MGHKNKHASGENIVQAQQTHCSRCSKYLKKILNIEFGVEVFMNVSQTVFQKVSTAFSFHIWVVAWVWLFGPKMPRLIVTSSLFHSFNSLVAT